jgi:hypothetical protein
MCVERVVVGIVLATGLFFGLPAGVAVSCEWRDRISRLRRLRYLGKLSCSISQPNGLSPLQQRVKDEAATHEESLFPPKVRLQAAESQSLTVR